MSEAFVYKWKSAKPGSKSYIGFHKGSEADGYTHSSKDDEFLLHFFDEEYNFEREILHRGTTKEMKRLEAEEITAALKRGEQLYNKSSGCHQELNAEHIPRYVAIIKEIQANWQENRQNLHKDFPVVDSLQESKTEFIVSLKSFQVRVENTNLEKVTEIAGHIRDNAPKTKHLRPVIVVTGVPKDIGAEGHDGNLLIDGNHTRLACKEACKPTTPTIFFPYHYLGNSTALWAFGLGMNGDPVIRNSSSDNDIKAFIHKEYENNAKIDSNEFRNLIHLITNKSKQKSSSLVNSVIREIEAAKKEVKLQEELASVGKQLVTYSTKDLNEKIAELEAPRVIAPVIQEFSEVAGVVEHSSTQVTPIVELGPVVSRIGSHATSQGIGMILSQLANNKEGKTKGIMLIHRRALTDPPTQEQADLANKVFAYFGIANVKAEALPDTKNIDD